MHEALAFAILAIGAVFVGLTVLIVANKAWRETLEARRRARRRELEPKVLAYAHGRHRSLVAAVGQVVAGFDRDVLEEIVLDHVQRVRGSEHERLARALDELGFVDEHLGQLSSRRWWVRARAAERLGLAGSTRATDALARALGDDVAEVRLRSAKALGLLGGSYSVRMLVQALDQPNRWSTIRVADILTGMGRQVVDELIATFPDLRLPGRVAALDILARIRPLFAVPWLLERLGDADADVRARTCHALGAIGDPNVAERLVAALDDEAWPVRAMAAKALGRVRSVDAVPALCRTMGDAEWWVRSNSAEAVKAMGAKGLAALERMLDDPDRYARDQAVLMLQEAGLVDERVSALAAGNGAGGDEARALVRKLVALGQTGRLRALAEAHERPEVREALRALLPVVEPPAEDAR